MVDYVCKQLRKRVQINVVFMDCMYGYGTECDTREKNDTCWCLAVLSE